MRPGRLAATAAAVVALGACATTYDSTITDDSTANGEVTATTTTLPSGTAAELLPLIVDEASGLSQLIRDRGDDVAAAERIAALWSAVSQEVRRERPDLWGDFDANVARCRKAAERDRAADADKAYLNLDALTRAYLG